jgi:hypothetical protein
VRRQLTRVACGRQRQLQQQQQQEGNIGNTMQQQQLATA